MVNETIYDTLLRKTIDNIKLTFFDFFLKL